ncbi:hypothetical protein SS1G_01949 [Sclerotinia sclerotiorum 1980 UF-70]|uniref:J domain-containing protein n=1 Tax=Sclerotinia sclerotiorum (strain ATCC 18683 / 1980 / Ss-1) TaxID=665079 RepID=A7E9G9_SCLS1|nr:hypothetical protein SS1G_01949 [Sclerotinia sclerotiorum 1980 UF-70]EDN97021.1 hypothetical protein SS1G_01949 [Sclerotinia sclerotiorum 1980 UF-70]
MVKADFDRDYYADLEIEQGASINEIKKQFRKLALVYHPDRNLGKETDITAKFQAIQSAHEVLTDPLERQRYDDARSRFRYTSASAFRSTKGNPYSSYGSEWAPPPKPPPYRPNRNPPPQSAGAARYSTFQTPKQSASAAAQEGPEARKSTFNAWESMKGNQRASASYRTGSGPTWTTPKSAPRNQYDREESSGFKNTAPPRHKPSFDDFRSESYHARTPSNPAPPIPKRNGFMPSNPGADEPSAGKGNYSTSRVNRNMPPPPPPREAPSFEQEREKAYTPAAAPPVNNSTRPSPKINDPLREFRTEEEPSYEPRLSTPYASAGGEKFDPFDAANLARSKTSRESFTEPKTRKPVPRAGSDPDLTSPSPNSTPKDTSPKDSFPRVSIPKDNFPRDSIPKGSSPKDSTPKDSFSKDNFLKNSIPKDSIPIDSFPKESIPKDSIPKDSIPKDSIPKDSIPKDNIPKDNIPREKIPRNHVPKDNIKKDSTPKPAQAFATSPDSSDSGNAPEINPQRPRVFAKPRKPTSAQEQRQPDTAPPETSKQNGPAAQEEPKRQDSMYDTSSKYTASNPKEPFHHLKHASFPGTPLRLPPSYSKSMQDAYREKYPGSSITSRGHHAASPPSGGSSHFSKDFQQGQKDNLHHKSGVFTHSMNTFEAAQHNLVDRLVANKERAQNLHQNGHVKSVKSANYQVRNDKAIYSFKATSAETSNFIKRPTSVTRSHSAFSAGDSRLNSLLLDKLNAHANTNSQNSFSMKLDDETFSPTQPKINTTFSSADWLPKFEAGGDYFVPERKTTQIPLHSRFRAQSASRPRARSPVKSRSADSKPFPTRKLDSDTPIESPGGTRFSPKDWEETFKPQTFAPPSIPSPIKPSLPPRVGSRRPRLPIPRPTVGSAAVFNEDDSSDDKPLFAGRNSKAPKPPASPDAMDVDSPPPATPAPPPPAPPPQASQAKASPPQPSPAKASPPRASAGLKINTDQLKRSAASSQSPVDAEGLGVDFHDLDIEDLLSSLNLPTPPTAPRYSHESYTALSQGIYLSSFTAYMGDWDFFAKRMLLHLLARKNQNDGLGSNRWENPQGLDIYRRGLKEDGAVMSHWVAAVASHDQAMKEFAINKERFDIADGRDRERPRKKTH